MWVREGECEWVREGECVCYVDGDEGECRGGHGSTFLTNYGWVGR